MIFKFSGKPDNGSGRQINPNLSNNRHDQGQKRPRQMEDLRNFLNNKRAKEDADGKSRGKDSGNSSNIFNYNYNFRKRGEMVRKRGEMVRKRGEEMVKDGRNANKGVGDQSGGKIYIYNFYNCNINITFNN